jgi:hypothetical protein
MRLGKFLSTIIFVTLLSVLYVYQQTEIFRFAYIGEKRQIILQDLLEKNNILRYNIKRNDSLVKIGEKFIASSDFEIPENFRSVRLKTSEENLRLVRQSTGRLNKLARLFSIKRQAEAKTINP